MESRLVCIGDKIVDLNSIIIVRKSQYSTGYYIIEFRDSGSFHITKEEFIELKNNLK